MTTENAGRRVTLSEVSKTNGIPRDVLALMANDDLFPQVTKGIAGHAYFPEDQIPTWAECIDVLEEERDRQLRRAQTLLDRLGREIEAVDNDIVQAREHPNDPLGVDLLTLGLRPYNGYNTAANGQPTVAGILDAFSFERMGIIQYDNALREAKEHTPQGDPKPSELY
jgi:hypothetical protein